MISYKRLYFLLFGAMEDAIEQIEQCNYGDAKTRLIQAQQEAEELYLSQGEKPEHPLS